jgi:hypothetical protein
MQASAMGSGPESVQTENYRNGYRAGRTDRFMGRVPLVVALNAGSGLPDYSTGYYDGYHRTVSTARHVLPAIVDDREGKILRLASTKDLTFLVRVLKSRRVYGRTDLLVTPVSGQGEAWVSERKLAGPDGGNGQ